MFLELIAVFAAGFGAAGLVLCLNIITRGRLPKWVMPVAAGAAMIGMSIWSEMSWADRTVAGFPDGLVVVEEISETAWWRPWTYLKPQTTRIMAVDLPSQRSNDANPAVVLVDVILFARWQPANAIPQFVDCELKKRAKVTERALADLSQANWQDFPEGNSLLPKLCGG
ncbi:MAG: hypothetical protein QGI08_06265 [Paracoccaceae bacterium]|jgi:hypothetical protein|nr:hypothetical protein [Paracoccaceae bacterium]MDP7185308.1 hypothetical protein [Paracoccaceae bacterium]